MKPLSQMITTRLGGCMSNPKIILIENKEIILNEVKNKLSGGVNLISYTPDECPWCNVEQVNLSSYDYEEITFLGEAIHYTEFLNCRSCHKRWATGYTRVYYEETSDD